MPHDARVQDYIRRIALERSLTLAEARRVLQEQIDHAKRVQASSPLVMSEKGTGRPKLHNPFRRHHEASEDVLPATASIYDRKKERPGTRQAATAQPESVKSPTSTIGTPIPQEPSRENSSSEMKSPPPGTEMSMIVGILRDHKSFSDAETALMGMARYERTSRSSVREKMFRACRQYDIPIR